MLASNGQHLTFAAASTAPEHSHARNGNYTHGDSDDDGNCLALQDKARC